MSHIVDITRYLYSLYVFFFQAEDGIRDYKVTGVQTCALPISVNGARGRGFIGGHEHQALAGATIVLILLPRLKGALKHLKRSEERRVGKECRSRWSPYH